MLRRRRCSGAGKAARYKIMMMLRTVVVPSLMLAAMLAPGWAHAEGSARWVPMDASAGLSDAELLERWQLISWDEPLAPVPASRGAIGGAAFQLMFQVGAGAAGGDTDVTRSRLELEGEN